MPIEEAQAIQHQRLTALRDTLTRVPLDHPALTLEIGCGHGHFMAAYAEAHPDEHCIAIDIIKERLEKADRKTTRAGLQNVTWLRAAAEDLLEALPSGTRFTRNVLVLFPDPWPKRRHWKNRLIQGPFLSRLAQLCAPGCQLCFRTDHAPYFEVAHEVVAAHPDWQLQPGAPWPFEQRTVFEARAPSFQSLVAVRAAPPSAE
ncbi:tRNA (guanine(46)-N(7))-methyltransferase TrmB [Actomonas aquatica]|uniref:tRNA (guanine-N(7)-)-methyltransferase n=1 Tax=Actomonas aquatica TaxID=2866162 RepID=A0ABZ1C3J4_9BACT|nr:methyltransferase domain-containing protein [Opitutus sp. WL0086]WRQ86119.1 methyltransferase domain-containing protein [Opitutus sp. WL0086]